MNKELLIDKINQSGKGLDEREVVIKDVSYRWGYWGVMLVITMLILLRFLKGAEFNSDLIMILMGHTGFTSFTLYKNSISKKMNLISLVLSLVVFIIATYATLGYYEII